MPTYVLLDLKFDFYYLTFVFSSTIAAYSFQRILKSRDDFSKTARHHWIDKKRSLLTVIFVFATIGGGLCMFTFSLESFYFIVPIGLVSSLYAGHFLRFISPKIDNLRSIPHIKIYLIAISWAFLTAVLPYFNMKLTLDQSIFILALSNFLFIWGITIPFDIRDVEVDLKTQRTYPQIFGITGARGIGIGLIVIAYFLLVLSFNVSVFSTIALVLCSGLIYYSTPSRNELYYTFWVEGSIIVWGGCVIADYLFI